MGRYTKITSDYIKSKRHQTLNDGSTIFERDWVTVGNDQVQQLDPGKKVYYSDSNFIFTINATKDYKKKHSTGKWVGSFYLDDVLGSSDEVNTVKVNFKSNDLRNYAYYGSAVELVKTSIENIIMDFPGRLKVTSDIYNKQGVNNTWIQLGYILDNQFVGFHRVYLQQQTFFPCHITFVSTRVKVTYDASLQVPGRTNIHCDLVVTTKDTSRVELIAGEVGLEGVDLHQVLELGKSRCRFGGSE